MKCIFTNLFCVTYKKFPHLSKFSRSCLIRIRAFYTRCFDPAAFHCSLLCREISSDASSNSSSSASLHRPLRDSSSSPLPGIRSRFEEDTSSENSDMGKTRETEIKATGSIHDR